MSQAYPESAYSVLSRLRDNPGAVAAELRAIQEAIPDVLNLIEQIWSSTGFAASGRMRCQPTSGEIFSTPKTGSEPTRWLP